jgi:transketolase
MRNAVLEALEELAANDERVVLLTGDLGFTVLERFAERFPDRFYNVGVAEQNMIGVATGLAEAGFVPFAYSIATFATMRPYEFLRDGPILHELPVRLVGVGGGLDYGHNGVTHYALEDVALMRVQPGMTTLVPADAAQARAAVSATAAIPGPLYLRVGKEGRAVPSLDGRFTLGRLDTIGTGVDLAIVALGPMASQAVDAAELLAARGVEATVAVVSSFNPSPENDLADLLARVPLALTVEAHYANGGLGSLVCEVVAERGLSCLVERRALRYMPRGETGSLAFLYELHGLSPEAIVDAAAASLEFAKNN